MDKERKEKTCLFFASDYHFEMITLPYITKKLQENKEIVIMTENNLDKTIKKVVSRIDLNKETEDKVLELDWKSDDSNKLEELKNIENNKDILIFIKGKEDYIKKVNNDIKEITESKKLEIIDCFDVNNLEDNLSDIAGNYSNILNTTGITQIKNA